MKNTIKNIAIATSLCSVLLLSTVSFAQMDSSDGQITQHEGNEHKYHQMSEKKLAKLTRKLGLSETQQSEFKAVKNEEKSQMAALKPALNAFRDQVRTLMSAESFDEQAFIQLQASNQDIFASVALVKAKSKFLMKSILTQEQLEKFNKMKNKRSRR
jgi:protein CpxP